MRFRFFLASWSIVFFFLLGWLASHKSSHPTVLGRYTPDYFTVLLAIAALAALSLLVQAGFLYMRLRRVRREIILTVSAIFSSLVIGETAIRAFDPLGISYFEESSRYQLDMVPDPSLVFKHASGLQKVYQGVTVSTNDMGLRDRKVEKKQNDELRILLLGDSVTFGWGVPVEKTFGRRLENILAAKLRHPARIVNSGVGGYNTVQEQALLRTYAGLIEPDVVVLLYVRNDIEPNDPPFNPRSQLDLHEKTPPEVIRILLGKSWLYRLGVFALKYARPSGRSSLDKNSRGVKDSMDALTGIATYCRDRGVNFVTFFYRLRRESTSSAAVPDELFATILDIGHKYGFPVIDVGAWWGNVDIRSITNSTVDRHPNQHGHEILAVGMADFLMKNEWVRKAGFEFR